MFGQKPAPSAFAIEPVDISSILQEASEEAFLSFQCFAETSDMSILNEASFIKDKFIQIIESIIAYIKMAVNKLIAFLDAKFKNLDNLIEKYRQQIEALTEEDVNRLTYEKVTYGLNPKVPALVDMSLVTTNLHTLSTIKLTREMVQTLRTQISTQLPLLRGQMIAVNGPVSESNFDGMIQRIFKKSADAFESKMTKKDLLEILDEVSTFQDDKKSIQASQGMIIAALADYKSQLGRVYSMKFNTNSSDVTIQIAPEVQFAFTVSILEASYYREYQALLTNFIMDITNLYSTIFDVKINTLKEKFERGQDVIRHVIYLIQDMKAN